MTQPNPFEDHPFAVIWTHLQQAGFGADVGVALLDVLLTSLQSTHLMNMTSSNLRSGGSANTSNAVDEVNQVTQFSMAYGLTQTPPTSILKTVELMVRQAHLLDKLNAEGARKAGRPEAVALEQRAKLSQVLIGIMRDMINRADRRALNASIQLEKMMDKDGRFIIGTDGDPKDPK